MASDGEYYDDDVDSDGAAATDDDDDDDGGLLEVEESVEQEPRAKFAAFTKEALSNEQQKDLSMVMNLFDIKRHHARAVLIRHRWNMQSIMDHMDGKGQGVMLSEAGVVLRESSGAVDSADPAQGVTCGVCFEDVSRSDVSAMDCGHSFCNGCWTRYFVACLDSGKKQIRCMAFKCPAICDEAVVQRHLGRESPAAAERFLDFLLQSYVDDNDAVRWCPSVPHCGRAIRAESGSTSPLCEVECPCGHVFCFRCAEPAHSPCPCAMWERWEAKCLGEAENVKWLLDNTKACPKCYNPIVKEGGCNHITCRCGQYLCWLCGAATGRIHSNTDIEGHSCNRFDGDEKTKKRKVPESDRLLRRYEHYYERFHAHNTSCVSERDELGPVLTAQAITRLLSRDSNAAQCLADAHRTLLWSRQVLSRSYVFAFYMFDKDVQARTPATLPAATGSRTLAQAQELFENFQEDVEKQVEKLSRLLAKTSKLELSEEKRNNEEEELMRAKDEALNLAVSIEAHCGKMYACIQDELLPMLVEPMSIAAFQKKGSSKAEELPSP